MDDHVVTSVSCLNHVAVSQMECKPKLPTGLSTTPWPDLGQSSHPVCLALVALAPCTPADLDALHDSQCALRRSITRRRRPTFPGGILARTPRARGHVRVGGLRRPQR